MGLSWWPWALLVLGIASLPWLVKALQRSGALPRPASGSIAVLSACAVGPQQRVLTVRVSHAPHEVVLVLGVTPQNIQCLHRWDARDTSSIAEASVAVATTPTGGA